jgi:hypothetical protein
MERRAFNDRINKLQNEVHALINQVRHDTSRGTIGQAVKEKFRDFRNFAENQSWWEIDEPFEVVNVQPTPEMLNALKELHNGRRG